MGLQFSSKPATGLSQASIFGSSLGGFLLNIRNLHPNERIRGDWKLDQDGRIEDGCCQNSNNKKNGVQYYTRPLIDYDMALFFGTHGDGRSRSRCPHPTNSPQLALPWFCWNYPRSH